MELQGGVRHRPLQHWRFNRDHRGGPGLPALMPRSPRHMSMSATSTWSTQTEVHGPTGLIRPAEWNSLAISPEPRRAGLSRRSSPLPRTPAASQRGRGLGGRGGNRRQYRVRGAVRAARREADWSAGVVRTAQAWVRRARVHEHPSASSASRSSRRTDSCLASPERPCPGCGAPTGYDRCLPCARRVPRSKSGALRLAARPDMLAPDAPSPAFSTGIG